MAGNIACEATNSVDKSISNMVNLHVRCEWKERLGGLFVFFKFIAISTLDAPVCSHDDFITLGAVKYETVLINCPVSSSPPPMSFHWTLRSSDDETNDLKLHPSEVGFQ